MLRLSEIEKKARTLGIKDTWRHTKTELIRSIQRKEGNFDCFGTAGGSCNQLSCCWREGCLEK
ncbi:MAG: SAP domain-containing protein [Candidatus Omnitrophota bacterium]